MKHIRLTLLFFGCVYTMLILHYALYDHHGKENAIKEVASRMKHGELSLSFKENAYKGFVYVH